MNEKYFEAQFMGEEKTGILNKCIEDNSLIFIKSPTGSGKTNFILKYMDNITDNSLFISVNKTNCHQLTSSIRKLNSSGEISLNSAPYTLPINELPKSDEAEIEVLTAYTNSFFECINNFNSVIINGLSLHRLLKEEKDELEYIYDIIVIDEISSLLNSILNPIDTSDLNNLMRSLKSLILLLRSAKKVICLDGYIRDDLFELFTKTIMPGRKSVFLKNIKPVNKNATIYVSSKINIDTILISTEFSDLREKLILALNTPIDDNSNRVLISSTSKQLILGLYKFCKANMPNISPNIKEEDIGTMESIFKTMEHNRSVLGVVVSDRLPRVNVSEYLNKKVILLYSPSVTTAVDIKGFEDSNNVFHFMNGNYVDSISNYQMVNRARQAGNVTIYCSTHSTITSPIKTNVKNFLELFSYFNTDIKNIKSLLTGITQKDNYLYIPNVSKFKISNLRTFIISFIKYNYENGDFKEILSMLNNGNRKLSNKYNNIILSMAYYSFKMYCEDKNNSVYTNFITLLKSEGYTIVDKGIISSEFRDPRHTINYIFEDTLTKAQSELDVAKVKTAQYLLLNYEDYKNLSNYKIFNKLYNTDKSFIKKYFKGFNKNKPTLLKPIEKKVNVLLKLIMEEKLILSIETLTSYQKELYLNE